MSSLFILEELLWYNIVVTSWPNKLKYLEGKEEVTMRKYFEPVF